MVTLHFGGAGGTFDFSDAKDFAAFCTSQYITEEMVNGRLNPSAPFPCQSCRYRMKPCGVECILVDGLTLHGRARSFGYSIGDFFTVPQFAWEVHKVCSASAYSELACEIGSLHLCYTDEPEVVSSATLSAGNQQHIPTVGNGC